MSKFQQPTLPMPYQSKLSTKVFKSEKMLPKPDLSGKIHLPSKYLVDICQYARGANSRGEWLFRHSYLLPLLLNFVGKDFIQEDEVGNIIVQVGADDTPWNTLHVGHVDSVHPCDGDPYQAVQITGKGVPVVKMLELAPFIKHSVPSMKKSTRWVDGKQIDFHYAGYDTPAAPQRCLGADDASAIAVMIYLISHKVAGTYFFARGEEHGCIGTRYAVKTMPAFFKKFKRSIEIDRKGTKEIINKMGVGVCASTEFAEALGKALNMGHSPSDKGSSTDVGVIAQLVPENVNVAAGYWLQHSDREHADPAYLNKLGAAMLSVDFNELPTVRKAGVFVTVYKSKATKGHKGHTQYTGGNSHYSSGYKPLVRNEWGDWSSADLTCTKPFEMAYPDELKARQFIRENMSLIWEVLAVMNYSTAELVEIATTGDLPDSVLDIEDEEFQTLLNDLEDRIETDEPVKEDVKETTQLTVVDNKTTH